MTISEGDACVTLPLQCHYLHSSYHMLGCTCSLAYLNTVWEALNILRENFPGHLRLHQTALPAECAISETELLRREVSLIKSRAGELLVTDELVDCWHSLGHAIQMKDYRAQNAILDILASCGAKDLVETRDMGLLGAILEDKR